MWDFGVCVCPCALTLCARVCVRSELDVVAGKEAFPPIEFSFPPITVVLVEHGDHLTLLEGQLIIVLGHVVVHANHLTHSFSEYTQKKNIFLTFFKKGFLSWTISCTFYTSFGWVCDLNSGETYILKYIISHLWFSCSQLLEGTGVNHTLERLIVQKNLFSFALPLVLSHCIPINNHLWTTECKAVVPAQHSSHERSKRGVPTCASLSSDGLSVQKNLD